VLVDAALARLEGVESIELSCRPEMIPFYRRWGFEHELGGSLLMRFRR
jgi:hypothetical protein